MAISGFIPLASPATFVEALDHPHSGTIGGTISAHIIGLIEFQFSGTSHLSLTTIGV
jgi:hypothetical protein